jgi:hypothetical protein
MNAEDGSKTFLSKRPSGVAKIGKQRVKLILGGGLMARSKPKATIMVADGAGGMMRVTDLRFEKGDWPITFEVPPDREQADHWTRYLRAECDRQGWSVSSLGQIERAENSGTITISANGKPQLQMVWERRREGAMKVKARLATNSDYSASEAAQFCKKVNDDCNASITEPIYFRGTLRYEGRAWRGEYWLDDNTRLAPPSMQDETATRGPRIVHVDAIANCVGQTDVPRVRYELLFEVSVFLSVVAGTGSAFLLADFNNPRTWVWTADMSGCEVRQLGYLVDQI